MEVPTWGAAASPKKGAPEAKSWRAGGSKEGKTAWGKPWVVPKLAAVCSLLVGPWGVESGREGPGAEWRRN